MILPAACALTVTCTFWTFLQFLKMSNSFLAIVVHVYLVLGFCCYFRQFLQQILNCLSFSLCPLDTFLVVISKNFVLLELKTNFVLIDHFPIEIPIFEFFNAYIFPLTFNFDTRLIHPCTACDCYWVQCLIWRLYRGWRTWNQVPNLAVHHKKMLSLCWIARSL